MKTSFILLFMLSGSAIAENANKLFDATHNMTNKVKVEWVQVKDIQKTCDKLAQEKIDKKFGYAVEACSFWTEGTFGYTCTVYTEKKTSMATLGHEMRHCFQGDWHK
jgi:hypothetical protein